MHGECERNLGRLKENAYPGRGIIIGRSPDGMNLIQVYWIMGRSANSRNRVFVEEDGFVRTKAYDESKVTDPSLIIYYPVKFHGDSHIVTNGDQTDTIYDRIREGKTFEEAVGEREFEPDAPNYTPRISGITYVGDGKCDYKLSVIKARPGCPDCCQWHFFNYRRAVQGIGHCIHTYKGDGSPLPSFEGEPFEVELFNDIGTVASFYWDCLDKENRVSLLVKFINVKTGESDIKLVNKYA